MHRRVPFLAAAVAALLSSSACQDYNFNPVGHCLIQPGTRRVTLSSVSTADVLFVVDDSGSMAAEQQALRDNFSQFMSNLATTNQNRVAAGLEAIDFHLAVTTTADYFNLPPAFGSVCTDQCPGALGSKVCCLKNSGGTPKGPQPPRCGTTADCTGSYQCLNHGAADQCLNGGDVSGPACCLPGAALTSRTAQPIACSTIGEECGDFDPFYYYTGTCDMSYVDDAAPVSAVGPTTYRYPAGKFMAPTTNSKVLHFTKELDWANPGAGTLAALATDFGENVQVGTCGSGQEQGLEAARRAVKGVLGQDGLTQPGVTKGTDWLHDDAKLVVVWVTDEEDCSAPYSAPDGVVFDLSHGCMRDDGAGNYTVPDPREYALTQYADFFMSLGRPFGAAFIASANTGCVDQSCYPAYCSVAGCTDPYTCGGQGIPDRYLALGDQLRARGADVVVGSICDSFGTTLARIAEIVKPPTGLVLPTQPAAAEVTILRIARADGTTRKTCVGPAPESMDAAAAAAAGYDWWFTQTRDQVTADQKDPWLASPYVYINHASGNCEANPGETYSADYLGQLPPLGCTDASTAPATSCAAALGGEATQWICEGYVAGVRNGTCLCN